MWVELVLLQSSPLVDWTNLGLAGAVAAAFAAGWIVAKPSVEAMKRQYEERLAEKDRQLTDKDAIIHRLETTIDAANTARIAALEQTQGIETQLKAIRTQLNELELRQ